MPIIKSSKKRLRQSLERRDRNRSQRSSVKTQIRKFLEAVRDKDVTLASERFRTVTKSLDQVAAKGVLHKNSTARKKSRLAARLNALSRAGA